MYKLGFVFLLALCVAASLLLSGCIDPLEAAKSSPTIKAFLEDYPNAELSVQLLSESMMQDVFDNTGTCCSIECPNMLPAQYYLVRVTDVNSGLNAFAYVDESRKVVCAFKEGKVSTTNGIDNNGNLVSVLPSDENADVIGDDNSEVIDEPTEPAVIIPSPETQFENVVCSTLPTVAVRMLGDMLVLTVPFPKELEGNLAEIGASVTYDSRTQFLESNGEKYAWCLMSDRKDCTVMITATLPGGTSETGAIVLSFEGDVLPFCSGCPPGSSEPDTSGGDHPVERGVNPCTASTEGHTQPTHGFLEAINATYDNGSTNGTYDNGSTNNNDSTSSLYDQPVFGQNGSTSCQYRNYSKPVVVFNRVDCKVQFDHPQSCPSKSGQVLCGQCEYTSNQIEHRGECYYCPSGSRCNWGSTGICGGAACISSGTNGGTNPSNYFTSCSNCQEGQSAYNYNGPNYTTCQYYYYSLCLENACADMRTNCR